MGSKHWNGDQKSPTRGLEKKLKTTKASGNSNWKAMKHKVTQSSGRRDANAKDDTCEGMLKARGRSTERTEIVALDCEMVGVGPGGHRSALARVSIVNAHGNVLLDTYVRPKEAVSDYRTHVSGVKPEHLEVCSVIRIFGMHVLTIVGNIVGVLYKHTISCVFDQDAPSLEEVRNQVDSLLHGRTVVGHALRNDFRAMMVSHPTKDVRDTAKFGRFVRPSPGAHYSTAPRNMKSKKLRDLAKQYLGVRMQSGSHSSVEDARAALYLYLDHKREWERKLQLKDVEKSVTAQMSSSSRLKRKRALNTFSGTPNSNEQEERLHAPRKKKRKR